MGKQTRQKVVLIGCGNVAWHIAKQLYGTGDFKIEVYNHRINPLLEQFKKEFLCRTRVGLADLPSDAGYYIICVPDRFISSAAAQIHSVNPMAVVLHTSGSARISELGKRFHGTGIMYPLQSFSQGVDVKWSDVPLILEASDKVTHKCLEKLAQVFSKKIYTLGYDERLRLHLAAVFVNNFTNVLFTTADELVRKVSNEDIDYKILMPLMAQTVKKLQTITPVEAQTGPARRGDKKVMKKHLSLLKKRTDLQKLYTQLSKLIIKQYPAPDAEF
jgi:predicted short-subunit dehydrogenase-like oxidoreductase (DUF2520 family)